MKAIVGFGKSARASSDPALAREGGIGDAQAGDVSSRAEVVPGASHHEDAHGGVVGQLAAGPPHGDPHLTCDGVALFRSIETQCRHARGDTNGDKVAHGCIPVSARISAPCSSSRGGRRRTPVALLVILMG